jgi:hypothetical protein
MSETELPLPSVTVVVEWDNARWSELPRARAMLRATHDQLLALGPALNESRLLILFDKESVQQSFIDETLRAELYDDRVRSRCEVVPTTGLRYYSLKNLGASLAATEVVAFVDSDVVPEPGWLPSLLAPFRDPNVHVVCGNTYMTADNIYAKAFALFWFMHQRTADEALRPVDYFFASNVAFRRHTACAHPYPTHSSFRGSCGLLCETLRAKGVTLWQEPRARVEHPPPNGLWHFVCRALCEGHDTVARLSQAGEIDQQSFKAIYWRFRASLRESVRRIQRDRERVGLRRAAIPLATGIATLYYALVLTGEWLAVHHPAVIRRYFAI